MIAVSSSGTGFRALAAYLVHGRTGLEEGRIGWASARNLPTTDPELAATLMRATAAQNVRVEKPVYHLALAFDPGDPVDRATMERVADRVLERLGLDGHQALVVAHRDREHPHLHILVNRVHPETGKVWDRWQDMPAIQEVLRAEERALGLRAVPGHLHLQEGGREAERTLGTEASRTPDGPGTPLPGEARSRLAEAPEFAASSGRPAAQRSADPSVSPAESARAEDARGLVVRARELLPTVREAGSWDEVDRALADAGMRLERRGSGLVVTDGERYAKASGVGPDLTLRRLEARLGGLPSEADRTGVRRDDGARIGDRSGPDSAARARGGAGGRGEGQHQAPSSAVAPPSGVPGQGAVRAPFDVQVPAFAPAVERVPSPVIERVARDVAQLERVRELAVAQRESAQVLGAERARLAAFDAAVERRDRTGRALDATFARVFVEPARARATFDTAAAHGGADEAVARLRERPESFGRLAAEERSRAFGLVRQRNDTGARQAAREAGALATEWVAAERGLAAAMGQRRGAGREAGADGPAAPRIDVGAERLCRAGALEAGTARERAVAAERRGLPGADVLERGIREVMRKLTPTEMQQLQAMLTRPQMALAMRVRQTVKEAVLGRDVGE